ncbi:MAG: hypothetical protein QOF44_4309 [Streptomyces sp.]|nr:hypothetical protein [Streptomyces sp.]
MSSYQGDRTGTDTWYRVVRKAMDSTITTGQYSTRMTPSLHGSSPTTASGPTTMSGATTAPMIRATM